MDAGDRGGDDRTFRVNFTSEGADRLRDRVKEKLKEFMGDYTDDTLVEYVIVLLRNGRRKDEASKELNVFLGDDCVSFVSWLWDHLSSNLHLYVQSRESFSDEAAKAKVISSGLSGRRNMQLEHVNGSMQTDSKYDRERSTNVSRNRRNREWKGLMQEETAPFSLRSTVVENPPLEEENHHKPSLARQSRSPRSQAYRKRSRQDESQPKKRDSASQPIIDAPRRLLQFAVRDAVRTVQQTSSRMEPALKRLRSVVSTSTTDSVLEVRPRTTSVARVSGGASTALKAAAEAAEDVAKVRCSGNVFDRLGLGMDKAETVNQSSDFREPVLEGESEDFYQVPGLNRYYQNGEYVGEFTEDITMLNRDTEMASDSASDNDGYDSVNIARCQGLDVSQSASSPNKDSSLMVQYSVAQNADEVVRKTRLMDQNPPANGAASASRKIVNISVNVNTWKPPHYGNPSVVTDIRNQMAGEKSNVGAGKPNAQILKENSNSISKKEIDVTRADVQKEVQNTVTSTTGSYTTGRPSDDVNSQIVFVSNVHFAATKDNLSRHFNKFGEVLKVIIVTDAATGQPKGSAYVEFLRKESAELALSLNGTSFMSRILKVVRRSSAHHEAAPTMRWPRIARASLFAPRLGVPFPRGGGGGTGAFRGRLPVKPGARSLQWKRDAPNAQIANGAKSLQNASLTLGNNIPSPTGRNLTYIRKESKQDGISAPTLLA